MHAIVHGADIQDRDGGVLVMASLLGAFPFLVKLYADAGYQGPQFKSAVNRILSRLMVEIVKRSDQAKGFVVMPKRWIVERTLACGPGGSPPGRSDADQPIQSAVRAPDRLH
jgi:transposase